MIFLIGTKDSNLKNGIISDSTCPTCKSQNSLHFSINRRYTYLTLVPLFPVGKYVIIKCEKCSKLFDYEDLQENDQEKLRNEKLKPSIWMFSGSIILILFIVYSLNNYIQTKDKTSILIKNPVAGDVYNLKLSSGYYSTLKINRITKDSIYTTHNNFNAYMPYEVDDINIEENYSDRKVSYSRKDLVKLYEEGEIIKISRKF